MQRRACGPTGGPIAKRMQKISYAGYRFPPEIIQQSIWLYLRFTLSLRDVEDLLAERGVAVSYETVRRWVNHFGPMIAADLRKRRLKPHATWHLDEVYLKIGGRMVYLWRAVDAEGEVLDVLVQSKRNKHAALKLMRKLLKKYAFVPERLVSDDLRSYGAAAHDLGIESRHQRGRWKNNRAENSHQPTRRRERKTTLQERRLSPEIPFNPCSRLQHFQRPTSSHVSPDETRASRCGDEHVADRGRSGLIIPETPTLRARCTAT
jgi:putative transposase